MPVSLRCSMRAVSLLALAVVAVAASKASKRELELMEHPETRCTSNDDCGLENKELGFRCCHAGACEQLDTRQDKYVAVNMEWFDKNRAERCPNASECGPTPECPLRVINADYHAVCHWGDCTKEKKIAPHTTATLAALGFVVVAVSALAAYLHYKRRVEPQRFFEMDDNSMVMPRSETSGSIELHDDMDHPERV